MRKAAIGVGSFIVAWLVVSVALGLFKAIGFNPVLTVLRPMFGGRGVPVTTYNDVNGAVILGLTIALAILLYRRFADNRGGQAVVPAAATDGGSRVLSGGGATASGGAGIVATNKKCPMCAEEVKREAKICRFCRYEFTDDDEAALGEAIAQARAAEQAPEEAARPLKWRVEATTWSAMPIGAEATLNRSVDRILIGVGRYTFGLPADTTVGRLEAGSLYLDGGRGARVQLAPMSGQDLNETLVDLRIRPIAEASKTPKGALAQPSGG
jgi:hypothetical protein